MRLNNTLINELIYEKDVSKVVVTRAFKKFEIS